MIRRKQLVAFAAAGALVLAACGSDDDGGTTTEPSTDVTDPATDVTDPATDDTDPPTDVTDPATDDTEPAEPSGDAFAVDVDACEDPDAASALIEGSLKIGTSIPQSGGPAVLFAPFGDGMQAYVQYYNETHGGINGEPIELVITDDQYTADLTVQNVDSLIFDEDVDMFAGIIGSPNNLAVQDDLNALCYPQLWNATGASDWGDVDGNPWTTGLLIPYEIESKIWADHVLDTYGEGASVAIFSVNNEFGLSYVDAFTEAAAENGLEIVARESIEAADSGAPSAQMTNLVASAPDAILAIPLGAQCIAFMTELGNAQAANAAFDPDVYLTATCANKVFFGAVQNGGSDGVYTSSNFKDVNDPANADDPDVAQYLAAFTAVSDADPGGIAGAGWIAAELGVYVAQQAADAGNLSRQGIIDAARNIDYTASLLRDGLNYYMDATDGYIAEGAQLITWNGATGLFEDQGDVFNYEGLLGVFGG